MRISGHKTRSVFDCYNITSEEDLKEAAKLPNEYFQKKMVTLPVTPAQYADMLESDRDLQPVEIYGGGGGIRTHGPLRDSGFQDRPIRPL